MKRLYFASLYNCNEDCLFCTRRGDEDPIKFIDTKKAKKILRKKKEEGYKEIYFDGGEPTLREDLPELIEFAKKLGFKNVNILTNAILLADNDLVKKILMVKNTKDFNLSFSVSLHSHKKEISEKLVGQKNTFNKTIKGIKNLIKNDCGDISLYHIITKNNYRDLSSFVNFVNKKFPEIKNITFSFIYPAGAALKNKNIFPQLSKVEPCLQKAFKLCRQNKIDFSISTCGTVPLCFLKGYEDILLKQQELDQPDNVGLVDAQKDVEYELATKKFHKKTKIKSSKCVDCFYNKKCGGIWRDYVEMYGMDELSPIVKKQGDVFLVVTGWTCNNNCSFCSTVADRNMNRSFDEIVFDLKEAYKKGYRIIEFIGGEVSIRPDFLLLLSSAKKIGFQDIRLTTNGRVFSYKSFLKKSIEAGLRIINFSLHGHKAIIHDGVTRTPDSFKQCVEGIKNAATEPDVKVIVNTVVSKANYKYIKKMGLFLKELGVGEWHLLELLPDGRASEVYNSIAVGYKELSSYLNKIMECADFFVQIDIFDFPFCLFKSEMFGFKNVTFFTPQNRYEDINQKGFDPVRVSKEKINGKIIYQDKYKIKPKICHDCCHFDKCGGLAKSYFEKYKDKEIKFLKNENTRNIL